MKKSRSVNYGFSLIEVMIAFVLLALAIATLMHAQTANMRKARKAADLIVASQLARKKLLDCKYDFLKSGLGQSDYDSDGDFSDEGFPEFKWECHAPPLDIPPPNLDLIGKVTKGDENQQPNIMTQVLGVIYPMIVPAISNAAREMTTIIRWQDTNVPQEMKIVTHIINQAQFLQTMSAFPNLGQLIQNASKGQQSGAPP